VVASFVSLLESIRFAIEDKAEAIGVYSHNEPIAIWVREPDYDYDLDGFYEISSKHPFNNYHRYNRSDSDPAQFWQHMSFFFGSSNKIKSDEHILHRL
jgi:hypothetical protein